MIDGNPWFLAVEICDILDLSNPTKALCGLEAEERLTLPVVRSGQKRSVNVVNESGLYYLIFQSRKPEAKAFRKWVTSEVLPNIRKTGSYQMVGKSKYLVKEPISDEFYINLCRSISVSGSQARLAEILRVSESLISELFTRPNKISISMRNYVGECCKIIREKNGIPETFPVERPRYRRSAVNKVGLLMDICKIDNSELRSALISKVMGGRAV